MCLESQRVCPLSAWWKTELKITSRMHSCLFSLWITMLWSHTDTEPHTQHTCRTPWAECAQTHMERLSVSPWMTTFNRPSISYRNLIAEMVIKEMKKTPMSWAKDKMLCESGNVQDELSLEVCKGKVMKTNGRCTNSPSAPCKWKWKIIARSTPTHYQM